MDLWRNSSWVPKTFQVLDLIVMLTILPELDPWDDMQDAEMSWGNGYECTQIATTNSGCGNRRAGSRTDDAQPFGNRLKEGLPTMRQLTVREL